MEMMSVKASLDFEKWARGYSGCDGGDIGESGRGSVWVCGIEWGGKLTSAELQAHIQSDVRVPPPGYDDWKCNLAWIYNWQVMKLLAAMGGYRLGQYKAFAEDVKPFVHGGSGFFKMNLYPIAFRNTDHSHWQSGYSELTGLPEKQQYVSWCNESRLPEISNWCKTHFPRTVICLGKTYRAEFEAAMAVRPGSWKTEIIDDRELSWTRNETGATVFVLPFMVNRNGLVKNVSIQKFGERMANIGGPLDLPKDILAR